MNPLIPAPAEVVVFVAFWLIVVAVAVASYRRSRCLSRHPIWKALAIAVVAGSFPLIWMAVSIVNRRQIQREWSTYRHNRAARQDLPASS